MFLDLMRVFVFNLVLKPLFLAPNVVRTSHVKIKQEPTRLVKDFALTLLPNTEEFD